MPRWAKRGAMLLAVIGVLAAAGFAYRSYCYPHGWSHCCDKQLMFALQNYASQANGWYPKGLESPEASLSLLHRWNAESANANLLRGKSVPVEVVQARLEAGLLLTPETCGWHYVEGLGLRDDPRLALFWDKVGLGHNGERMFDGGHWVCFVNGDIRHITGDLWQEFLAEQEQLRAALKR